MTEPEQKQEPQVVEPILTNTERHVANEVCGQVLAAWEKEQRPCDLVELAALLNQGAARACKRVRDASKPTPAA